MLDKDFFSPKSVAVIGASSSPDKLGHVLVKNIIDSGFKGKVYPVNQKEKEILSLTSYPQIADIPGDVDMAMLSIPWQAVSQVLKDCADKGIKRVVMISAGFRETGAQGSELEEEVLGLVRRYGIRMLGPNCLGFINPALPINATFASGMPVSGNIALVAQSGAMRQSFWDWSQESGCGLSKFISLGNAADITATDALEMLKDDEQTNVVTAYFEGIPDGGGFREAAKALSRVKPLIIVKSGSTTAGSRATMSHTGSMAGTDEIHSAVFKQSGIIRAKTPEQLFDFTFGLSCQPLLRGNRLAVITNAGGPGVMSSDAIEGSSLKIASLREETTQKLLEHLHSFASVSNPVDLTGSNTPAQYEEVVRAVISDPNVDGALVILCPQGAVDVSRTAAAVIKASDKSSKPVFVNFMGRHDYHQELAILEQNGIPNYPSPERAIDGFIAMNQYREWLARRDEPSKIPEYDREAISRILNNAKAGNTSCIIIGLTAANILEIIGIKPARSIMARNSKDAVKISEDIGYPVAMKIVSPYIIHKTEFGGVRTGLYNPESVAAAYTEITSNAHRINPTARIDGVMMQEMAYGQEVILGFKRDDQFGPALMFGLGGIYTEVLKDISLRVAPISHQDAIEMINEIRTSSLLTGARGKPPADINTIANYLTRLSQLSLDFPEIRELDINPALVGDTGKGVIAVDCRLIIDNIQ